jgi:hypothetical protein
VCRRKQDRANYVDGSQAKVTENSPQSDQAGEAAYGMYNLESRDNDPIVVNVQINDTKVDLELDSGAGHTIISEFTYKNLWGPQVLPLEKPDLNLRTYTGEHISVLGKLTVDVEYNTHNQTLPLYVVTGDGPGLLGRTWMRALGIMWDQIKMCKGQQVQAITRDNVLNKHQDLFKDELGKLQGYQVHLAIKKGAQPKFCKARPVPLALKSKVSDELHRLEQTGVIERVTFSQWAAPIVPVMKQNGQLRICGDYKTTVNQVAEPDTYPLPRVEELFTKLAGGQTFSKLDLSSAYQQLELDEVSRELVTINTQEGLFQYRRCPYGVSTAPSLFQRTMDSLLAGIPHTAAFLDDVLVTGATEEEHLSNLDAVLTRMQDAGLRLNPDKCVFFAREVTYLGHKISAAGLQPTDDKVRAIDEAPNPTNVTELKSFLGLVNYYGKFISQLASLLAPLHQLLCKNAPWTWGKAQQEAFDACKHELASAKVLAHYDADKPLILCCDASPYGVGVVLAQRMDDAVERPIAYASRSLSPAEKNYSQLDREGLAMVFGVKKFHTYLYGRDFVITTDHKPLLGLFGENRPIPAMASSRIQRWALTLAAYRYQLVYRRGVANSNADGFSRLPLPDKPTSTPAPADYVFVMDHLESTPVNSDKIRVWTGRDPMLSQVRESVLTGWPAECPDPNMKPYVVRKDELSVHDGCIMWGARVVVPPQGRKYLLEELHDSHSGIVRMKALARSYIWWPGMDSDLETMCKNCSSCQLHRKVPPKAPMHPWEWPSRPWTRLHIDFAGPKYGHMFLVVVDAHTKWLDVIPMKTATLATTIEKLRVIFATHGLPQTVVSDNGSVFTSVEFADFMKMNGIKHVKVAPFHPASNGLAERAVQSFKYSIDKMTDNASIETKVSRFLLSYRITPHTTTGQSPAEMLMKRQIRSRLDLARPDLEHRVQNKQQDQKSNHDKRTKLREFQTGATVYARNFARGPKWLPGTVVAELGPLSYRIELVDGRVWRRHVDHIMQRQNDDKTVPNIPPDIPLNMSENLSKGDSHPEVEGGTRGIDRGPPSEQSTLRRSQRAIRPPVRFGFD